MWDVSNRKRAYEIDEMCEGYNPPIEGILENFPDVLFTNCIKRGKSILKIEIGGPRLVYVFNKLNLIPSSDIIRRLVS